VLVSRIWQDTFDDPQAALGWPREALFDPLGMTSAVLETDARGTFVGSSYLYATARDWARFGLFLLQDGPGAGRPCCRRAMSTGCARKRRLPRASTAAAMSGCTGPRRRTPDDGIDTDFDRPTMPSGCSVTTGRRPSSCHLSIWWWCGWV
jgi:CubicO group peptidase (beta-lactamase class C family)